MKNTIIITRLGGHLGSGHYHRSLKLAKTLGLKREQLLCLAGKHSIEWGKPVSDEKQIVEHIPLETRLVVFDIREPSANKEPSFKTLHQLKKRRVVLVGLDVFGKTHAYFDYVINGIPSLASLGEANLHSPEWLPLPTISINRKKNIKKKIIVFLGYKDSGSTYKLLKQHKNISRRLGLGRNYFFSIYLGKGNDQAYHDKVKNLMSEREIPGEVKLQSENFFSDLRDCALLISHFGLSSLEAINFKVPTLFWNVTDYHHQLSKKHFPSLVFGFKNKIVMTIKVPHIEEISFFYKQNLFLGKKYAFLSEVFKDLLFLSLNKDFFSPVIYRRTMGNFYKNTRHHWIEYRPLVRPASIGEQSEFYGKNYFFEEYQKAYGKTYEQDKENIGDLSNGRLNIISKYISGGDLLDIGCALGYFLDMAEERHFRTYGVELSQHGYQQAKKKHQVLRGDFCELTLKKKYQVITLWYVIEHFFDIFPVLKKIASLQRRGSVVALSTPNACGLIGRFSLNKFLETSPTDHYYLFDPKSLKKAFESFGYRLLEIRYTGIYYSRFKLYAPMLYKFIPKKIYFFLARFMGWGDTFEMYFMKIS